MMEKTADRTVVQKTLSETLHKEGEPEKDIVGGAG